MRPVSPLRATYRLQLHKDFSLDAAREIVPYLARLGVSHAYVSPILAARPGSTHGYDVVDPARVNPELGGEASLRGFVDALHGHDMGLLLDIVPNHMGTGSANPYWQDVLARGRQSRFAHWFDIDWHATGDDGPERIVLPVLGDEIEAVVERGELAVIRGTDGVLALVHHDKAFPLSPETLARLDSEIRPDAPESRSRIREIADAQHYRLAFWKDGPDAINYRRFFDVDDLVALRMEDPDVFTATHDRILGWVADGTVDGLRIDHIDGLLDPAAYLERLRSEVTQRRGPGFPILVEKILSPGERLRSSWPVQGTTGYETLNDIEDLFIDPAGFESLERAYRRLLRSSGTPPTFEQVAIDGKLRILGGALRADVSRLARLLEPIAAEREALVMHGPGIDGGVIEVDRQLLAEGIVELIACLPVYRTYLTGDHRRAPEDVEVLDHAFARVRQRGVARAEVVDLLGDLFRSAAPSGDPAHDQARRRFILRFQQASGPATAKGVEDTALYTYMPLVSRNEVGGAPDRPLADAARRFDEGCRERATRWPFALVCTNTHDTKRSADVRARLDVLAEMPDVWWERVRRWRSLNRDHHITLGRRAAPDPNTEYLFYQILLGVWPIGLRDLALPAPEVLAEIHHRVDAYMLKAGKEGKSRTSWTEPVTAFEDATKRFVHAALFRSPTFLQDFAQFAIRVIRPGLWNALSRVTLHLTAPGTPDIYQGDEIWKLALVDPDNRRPVDYAVRDRMLAAVADRPISAGAVERPEDGRIKLHLLHSLLRTRREHPALFADGDYLPFSAEGTHHRHVVAFARLHGDEAALVVAPRLAGSLVDGRGPPIGNQVWTDTTLPLPKALATRQWRSALTGAEVPATPALRIGDLCAELPVAVLVAV
jgi:malto-oligosyltrehalose synthase